MAFTVVSISLLETAEQMLRGTEDVKAGGGNDRNILRGSPKISSKQIHMSCSRGNLPWPANLPARSGREGVGTWEWCGSHAL